jgi:hypothetical protein
MGCVAEASRGRGMDVRFDRLNARLWKGEKS